MTVAVAALGMRDRLVAQDLTPALLELAGQLGLSGDELALHVETRAGLRVASHRADHALPPASCLKLATAFGALDLLGPDFQFRTELHVTGTLSEGELVGDVIVVGRGDPAINGRLHDGDTLAALRPWVRLLSELGIQRVHGRLLADDGYFSGPIRHPDWPSEQLARWYCAPSGALNLNDNCLDLELAPGTIGTPARLRVTPSSSLLQLDHQLLTVATRNRHRYSLDWGLKLGSDPADTWPQFWPLRLRGGFWSGATARVEWVSVPDPSVAFLGALRQLLTDAGIEFTGGLGRTSLPAEARLVASLGHPLALLLPSFLKRSLNVYGDCLLKAIGKEHGQVGSFEGGAMRLEEHLHAQLPDLALRVRDGSGLSASNRLSAGALVQLLGLAEQRTWYALLRDSLAVAGQDGTLEGRFRNSPVRGQVRAKTGHINGVSTLAGWLQLADGGELRFALFYHGAPGGVDRARQWQERVLERLAREFPAPR